MKNNLRKIVFLILILFVNSLPIFTLAYQLLEPSVLLDQPGSTGDIRLASYLRSAYLMLFVITITVAIITLIIRGIQMMTTDIPGVKISSKLSIWKALGGLFIALTSYLILNIINPELVSLENLKLPGIS